MIASDSLPYFNGGIWEASQLDNSRINWIDICKALGIFLVVLGHTYRPNVVKTWIYSFHMPLFVFLSGYVFNSNKYTYRGFTIRRFKSLIVPYFAFAFISYAYWLALERHFRPSSMNIPIFKPILGYLYGSIGPSLEPNVILWFLPCLFVTEIIFYFSTFPHFTFHIRAII